MLRSAFPVAALALLTGLIPWGPLCGQQHSFRQLTTRDGLAQSQVRCIAQDADGYLWFGTLGGASRFDGRVFTNHALQDGLPDAQVSAMVLDANGVLWSASGNGLVQHIGRQLKAQLLPGVDPGIRIMALASDDRGRVFAGTDGAGLYVHEKGSIRMVDGYPLDTAANIRALLKLSDGRLLIGLRNGLLIWDGNGFTNVAVGDEEPKAISALAEGPDGSWWVGTFIDGLYRIAPNGERTAFDEESGLLRNNIRSLLFDDSGRLWIGTKFGLNLYDGGRMRVFTIHQGLPNDNISCAFQDNEGNLWFGTDGAGAMKYAGDRFVTYTVKDGLCSDLIMTLTEDLNGDLWLGTYDNGVCRMDGMAMVNTLDGLPNNTVWCSLTARNGELWFGTSDGLVRIERGIVKPLPTAAMLSGQRVMALYQDDQDRIWAGTRDGVRVIGPDLTVMTFPGSESAPDRSVRSIIKGGSGSLWFASDQGVARYDGSRISSFTTKDGLCDNTVFCLFKDASERIWIGTSNGISCFANNTFTTIRFASDFGSNYIDLLIGDTKGRIWAGTNNGVFLFHPDSLLKDPAAHEHINLNKGLRSLEFNLNAAYRDRRGRLFMGSSGGLVMNDARKHGATRPAITPRLHITGIRSFLERTDWKGASDGLDGDGLPIGLHLPYRRNHITFDYAGICLSEPDRVVYRYRLSGVDDAWLPPTDARFASYSNLNQGEYTFEVMASVLDGPWSAPVAFTFRIESPFWLRWWFFLICAALALGSTIAVARYRSSMRERRERTRQLMLRSRMLQLEQQALNANMNRHFVFNALNSIQYHINKQDKATASRYLTSFAKLIRKNLDASQSDTTTLAEELERLELYLTLEHMRFKDRFRYEITVSPDVDTHHVRLPAMMLQPYVENSIWHGILPMERQGFITIAVQTTGPGRVGVLIQDDGIGVDHSKRRKQGLESDHISRGIEITKGRADVLRRLELTDIRILGPEERHDPTTGVIQGTQVLIELPGSHQIPRDPGTELRNGPSELTFGTR